MANNRLETVKWAGYRFKFEKIIFEEDNMEVETVLLPIKMFEDFISYHYINEYKESSLDNLCTRLGNWLENNDLDLFIKNHI